MKSKEQTKLLQKLYFHLKRHPKKSDKCKKHSCEWHKQRFTVNASSSLRERERETASSSRLTNIHSYCALFLRQHGGTKRAVATQSSGWWLAPLPAFAATLARFFFLFVSSPLLRTAWLKATCYTLSLTHTRTHTNPLTQRLRLIFLRSSSGVSCC